MMIYVAAKYEDRGRAQEIMRRLRQAGHEITYDWTIHQQISPLQAQHDLDGVRQAEALVLVVEKDLAYCGTLVEFGIALCRAIPIYIVGRALDTRCIFMQLPSLHRGFESLL